MKNLYEKFYFYLRFGYYKFDYAQILMTYNIVVTETDKTHTNALWSTEKYWKVLKDNEKDWQRLKTTENCFQY